MVQSKKRVFDDFFKIDEASLQFERFDGEMTPIVRRLNFERGDSVAALILNKSTGNLVFVNQFKYPTYDKGPGWITETLAGMIDNEESPEEAISREIFEEIGCRAIHLEHISTFYVSPGGSSERIILYYAEVAPTTRIKGGGVESENENIMALEISPDEALKQIAKGDLIDAKTILAVYWYRANKKNAD